MAHDGIVRIASMSLGATESAMSSSEVRSSDQSCCIRSSIAFAFGLFNAGRLTL